MAAHMQNPGGKAGASRDSFAGLSLPFSTPCAMQSQLLIASHHVRPEMAAMIAALAFEGGKDG